MIPLALFSGLFVKPPYLKHKGGRRSRRRGGEGGWRVKEQRDEGEGSRGGSMLLHVNLFSPLRVLSIATKRAHEGMQLSISH